MKIVLLGVNHRTAPLELRERLAVEDPVPPLQKLVAGHEIDETSDTERQSARLGVGVYLIYDEIQQG